METFGRMILGAFAGAVFNPILLYCYVEFPKNCYVEFPKTDSGVNWGAGIVRVLFGLITGIIIGGINSRSRFNNTSFFEHRGLDTAYNKDCLTREEKSLTFTISSVGYNPTYCYITAFMLHFCIAA